MTSTEPGGRSTRRSGVVPWGGVLRQTRRDAAPLAVGMVVVAAAAFLSAAVPLALDAVATSEVRAALTSQDEPVTVVVTAPITDAGYQLDLGAAGSAADVKDRIDAGMPSELRGVLTKPVTALVGPELKAGVIADRPGSVRFIYLASESGPAIQWVEGRAPAATGDPADVGNYDKAPPIEVAISQAGADLMGVRVGGQLAIDNADGQPLEVWLSGIYRAVDPADDAWAVAPTLLKPQLVGGSAAFASVGLLASGESLPFAELAVFPTPMTRTYTYRVVPSALDASLAAQVATQARGLASGRKNFDIAGTTVNVATQLDRVIDGSLARVAAAAAQASVLLIGLLSAAVLVELLAAGLVVERRAAVLRLWRSRGATQPAIGLANAAESTLLAAVAGLIGLAAVRFTVGGVPPWGWVAPPLIVAALLQPVLAMRTAGRVGTPRTPSGGRVPLTAVQVRRLGAEGLVVLVAAAALVTLAVRGATASAGSVSSDAVVLAAPVLVALAVTLGLVRVQPRVLRAARALAARGRGAVPLLASARTKANGLATAALVTASAIAAIAASVAGTVIQGQEDASWDAVGADAAAFTSEPAGLPPAVAALNGTGGLVVATATVIPSGQVIRAPLDKAVTIIAVDADALGALLASTPAPDAPSLPGLARTDAGALPILVTGGAGWEDVTLRWGDDSVTVRTVGDAPALPARLDGDTLTVVVDRLLLSRAVGREIPATLAWVVGPQAGPRLQEALTGADARVSTRSDWLTDWAASPVTRALGWLFAGASAAAAALAALAVALMAASGSGERARAVAQIRVVGTPRAAAARVAWLEAAIPAVVASAVGIATGIGLAGLLVVALDLPSVTGGNHVPPLVIPWWILVIPVALGLVARIAVAIAGSRPSAQPLGPMMRAG